MKLPPLSNRLPRSFYDRPTPLVARQLLGKALLRKIANQWVGGLIVETEAYLSQQDPASHSARGMTRSNTSMFGPPGTLYVYPIHAKYCMNAVTEGADVGSATLIRAIEPLWGIEIMKHNRGFDDPRRLTRGPAMLCQAIQVDRQDDGIDLVRSQEIVIAKVNQSPEFDVDETPRIGISKAKEAPLRFLIRGSRFVSR